MMRFTFKRGLIFVAANGRWTLEKMGATGKLELGSDTGEQLRMTPDELRSKWLSGEWAVDESCLGTLANTAHLTIPRDLSTYTPYEQRCAMVRQGYIQAVSPEYTPYEPARWKELIDAHGAQTGDESPPCASTVQNWWRKYRATKSIAALIPRRKGRHGPAYQDARKIFEEAIDEVYLSSQKNPKIMVYERVALRIHQANQSLPPGCQVRSPSRATVYRWMEELRQDVVDGARLGADVARIKYRTALGGLRVRNVLDRLEVDHTPMDVILIDTQGRTIGRPWLTLAIDRASRMIMGFYISLHTPSAYSVLSCLRQSILPKNTLLAQFPGIKGRWPAQGIPALIAVDNGMDLHSSSFQAACQELGIQLLYCAAKTPMQKGSIERHMRTTGARFIHQLPGTTFSNINERGDYPSEKMAAITLRDLTFLITEWITDVYLLTKHRGIGMTPLSKWDELAEKRSIELPLSPGQLEIVCGASATRTLFHYGIELDGIHYNSTRLQEFRRQTGDNRKVNLKHYENSIDHIHVLDPGSMEYIRVPAVNLQYSEDLPREAHRQIRAMTRQEGGSGAETSQLLENKERLSQHIAAAVGHKKMNTRKRAQNTRGIDSETIFHQASPSTTSQMAINKLAEPPERLPDGLQDELPDLGFFKQKEGEEDDDVI